MIPVRQTKLIVNTKHIEHNIRELQNFVGPGVKIIPVIKARGYGTGIGTRADVFKRLNIDFLSVAVIDEGTALRKRGYINEILVLNQPFEKEIEKAVQYNLILGVCVPDFIRALNQVAYEKRKNC